MKDIGFTDKLKGNIKETVGKVTGDEKLKAEGTIDKISGKVKEVAENVKDAAEEVSDKVKEKLDQ